jgi:hypothetical protein
MTAVAAMAASVVKIAMSRISAATFD